MRIIIYGAGAIGSIVGGHLARVGYKVALIGRPHHMKAIKEKGLKIITPNGIHILDLQAVTVPDQIQFFPDDVVFLCVKAQNTGDAVRDLKMATKDLPIFCLQNGVRNEEITANYFSRVYAVAVRVTGVYLTDGEVVARRDPPGWFVIGRYPQGTDELIEEVAKELRDAGFGVIATPDIMPYKWGKLVVNIANAFEAITNVKLQDMPDIINAAKQEAIGIMNQAGICWIPDEKMEEQLSDFATMNQTILKLKELGSTWQSLARKQGSAETDFVNGEIVRLAKKMGLKAPINKIVLRICNEMAANHELPGKYTPEQLRGLLKLK